MANKTKLSWQGNMAFQAELDGHLIKIDTSAAGGTGDTGPRPKALLLVSLAGCSGMDVVSILKKMKIDEFSFSIQVEGEQTEEHPKYYKEILIQYYFDGNNLPADKLKRAVELSQTQYCGVSAMLSKAATISAEIYVNGELL